MFPFLLERQNKLASCKDQQRLPPPCCHAIYTHAISILSGTMAWQIAPPLIVKLVHGPHLHGYLFDPHFPPPPVDKYWSLPKPYKRFTICIHWIRTWHWECISWLRRMFCMWRVDIYSMLDVSFVLVGSVWRAFAVKLKGALFKSQPGTVGGPVTIIMWGTHPGWNLAILKIFLYLMWVFTMFSKHVESYFWD